MYNNRLIVVLISLILSATFINAKVTGGSLHKTPDWFKESFLDITDDVDEANEQNKHLMLFMDLNGCPYCARMLKESFFTKNNTSDFIKKQFDVININVQGSKEITWDEDTILNERQLAQKLNVQYSPTIIFLDDKKNVVVRVNGYRSAKNFKYILDYVDGKHYKTMKLSKFKEKIKSKKLYKLKENKLFSNLTDLSKISSPLAVIFEDGGCTQCEYLHNTTLKNKEVIKEFKKFTVVRLDATSNDKIITPEGKVTTPKQWALDIDMSYRPGILLYDEKELISTIDALLYSHHFKELLRYVSGKYYDIYNGYLPYLRVRNKELTKKGINIDLSKEN